MQTSEQKKTYDNIIKLYDFAEDLVEAIEKNPAKKPEERLKLVEPLIEQIEESAEILAQVYISFVETGVQPDDDTKIKVDNSINKMFEAISIYKEQIKKL